MEIHYVDDCENALLKHTGKRLTECKLTVGTAESCTGGWIACMFASEPESSECFIGGIVSYSEEIKKKLLGVSATDIEKYGVVSRPVAEQMARGACRELECSCAIATTGFAGPNGGSEDTPVGTVWIAVMAEGEICSRRFVFDGDRQEVVRQTSRQAIGMLLEKIDRLYSLKQNRMETKSKNQGAMTPAKGNGKFREFFADQLKDVYWAEQALTKALPKMMEAATSKKLAKAFEQHARETEGQMRILEQVFQEMGEKAEAKKCEAMNGIIKEAEEVIKDTEKDSYTRDAGLVLAGQKTEHYEIATYGTLVELARQMGETKVAELLQKILKEEKKTDISLTVVAEDHVNEEAVQE